MGEVLTFTEESEPVPSATVTLVEGSSFVISGVGGDIGPGAVEGVFVGDTRVCSKLRLTLDGVGVEALAVADLSPFEAVFVGRSRDRGLLVRRDLHVGRGARLDLELRNLDRAPRLVRVQLAVQADLADLFAVKEGRAAGRSAPCTPAGPSLVFGAEGDGRGAVVRAGGGAEVGADGTFTWAVDLEGLGCWQACVEVAAVRGGEVLEPRYRCGEPPGEATPAARQARWRDAAPRLETDVPGLGRAFARATEDLGGLQLFDPDRPEEPLVAAGAPWFMTLFGRDSLLTSWMALPVAPLLAQSTLRTLARLQGRVDDPDTEEQPGRILHEVRFSAGPSLALADGEVYYGTADATPLFVVLASELLRWGAPFEQLAPLLPAVDAALEWLAGPGDPDGDGYVEYAARSASSLVNQGWKDSFDGVSFADGRLPEAPIALAEVQAYAYAAWLGGAELALAAGDAATAAVRRHRADALQAAFERDFWLPDRGAFALALDRDKRPVDAVASNMGHCLWAGIVRDPEQAAGVASWLAGPELFSGWGVRTLATTMGRYNPLSYHNGSVWPHDTALCIVGLRRAGFVDEALGLTQGLLAAAEAAGGRLPELFAGIAADDVPTPVPYPASCSPQAWAAAAPFALVRAVLGLEPDLPAGVVAVDPRLPAGSSLLRLRDVPLGPHRVTFEVDGDALAVRGLPSGVAVVRRAR